MPAKKKSLRSKSSPAAAAAKEALLAHEAEVQKQVADRERACNDESALRKETEEEEARLFEAYRVQESELRVAVAEAERRAYYEAKERELTAALRQKTTELQEAQAKLGLAQQANDALEREKASALRRVALLTNELELAQVSVTAAEERATTAAAQHRDVLRQAEADYDALQQAYHELEQTRQSEAEAAAAAAEASVAAAAATSEPTPEPPAVPSSDEETAMLLRVMQADMERYKATATQLQAEVAQVRKEEEKSNLLVGILNTQLESVREENKRLHELSMKRQSEVVAAAEMRREAQDARHSALTDLEQTLSAAAVQQRQLQLELDVHRREAERLTEELAHLRKEHAALSEELRHVSQQAAQQAQSDLATNVAMQAELSNQKKDLEIALKAKEKAEDERFNHKILTRAELDGLRTRLHKLQETLERKERESFETIAALRADVAQREAAHERRVAELEAESKVQQAQLQAVLETSEKLEHRRESLQQSSGERERELYEELTRVSARYAAATEELERLRAETARKDVEYTNNAICLNAENENLKSKLQAMAETAAQHHRMHVQYVEKMRAQTTELQARVAAETAEQESSRARESARADLAERNVRRLQEHVRELEQASLRGNFTHDEAVKSLQAENRDLRSELSTAKRTIERLECTIGDLSGYHQLVELNDRLTKELESSRRTVGALHDKATMLQSEAETMGGYRVQKVQEEKEQMMRRLQQMERRYRRIVPLFAQLRALVEAHIASHLHPELTAALEAFDREMSLSATPRPTSAVDAADDGEEQRPFVAADLVGSTADLAAAAMVPAAATDGMTTIPTMLRPRPPFGSTSSATAWKATRAATAPKARGARNTSIIVTGTHQSSVAGAAGADRLPMLS